MIVYQIKANNAKIAIRLYKCAIEKLGLLKAKKYRIDTKIIILRIPLNMRSIISKLNNTSKLMTPYKRAIYKLWGLQKPKSTNKTPNYLLIDKNM